MAKMEDVLEVYHRPYDSSKPVICLDESSKQLIKEVQKPIPATPGKTERFDSEYEKQGTRNIFLACEPLMGKTFTSVTKRRTRQDFAKFVKETVAAYPKADKIILVMDNLNTHTTGSLYEAFPPEEARKLAEKLEIHYTPVHGSWLNMAEIELSALSRQCLNRRIPDADKFRREVKAWTKDRNSTRRTVKWQFNVAKARIKLARLYPVLVPGSNLNSVTIKT